MGIQRGFFVIKQYFFNIWLKRRLLYEIKIRQHCNRAAQGHIPNCAAQSPLPSRLDPL